MNYYIKIKKFFFRSLAPIVLKRLPLKNRYLFSSFFGQYNDSPKIISEELHTQKKDVKIYWIFDPKKEKKSAFPKYVHTVKINTLFSTFLLWTSKYLVDNCQKQLTTKLRKNQVYVQTWHGTPLKKIEFDTPDKLTRRYLKYSDFDNKSISYLLVGNEYSKNIYKTAFHVDQKKYCLTGIPRNDVFFKENIEYQMKLKKELSISQDTFLILYAPTFRNTVYASNDQENGIGQLRKLNPKRLVEVMQKKLQRKCIIVTHFHPNVAQHINNEKIKSEFGDFVIDLTSQYSTQALMQISDLLITDYSSVFFDFALSKRAIILFAYDYDHYIEERGTYVQLNQLPLYVAKSSEEMCNIIGNHAMSEITQKTIDLNNEIGSVEKGNATQRVVSELL